MALANIGEILADRGYNVIMCDWDFEAPGLERYFVDERTAETDVERAMAHLTSQPGLMDLLLEYKDTLAQPTKSPRTRRSRKDDASWQQIGTLRLRRPSSYAFPVSVARKRVGTLRLLTVGRRHGDANARYADAVRSFDWEEFYEQWAGDSYFEFLRKELDGDRTTGLDGAADIVLLDSRTGVTEHGGVCTHHLADLVVTLTAANDLNTSGTLWILQALSDPRLVEFRAGRALRLLPVASRIEQTSQKEELVAFRNRFVEEFGRWLPVTRGSPAQFALASEIPYMPFYAFRERVVAREPEGKREQNLYSAYRTLADEIVRLGLESRLLLRTLADEDGRRKVSAEDAVVVVHDTELDKHVSTFIPEVEAAAATLDRERVAELSRQLVDFLNHHDVRYPEQPAARVLTLLRQHRYFDLMQQVAEAFLESGLQTPRIRRLYATAMVDQGNVTAARALLDTFGESEGDPKEFAEAKVLVGRLYKHLFVRLRSGSSKRRIEYLNQALEAYYEAYRRAPREFLWHGVNVVALLCRAEREGLRVEGYPDPKSIARDVFFIIESRVEAAESWDCAAAAEAALAIEHPKAAVEWCARFVSRASTAFEIERAPPVYRRVGARRRP